MGKISMVDKKIYCFWTDDNPLPKNRIEGLKSMRENLGVPIEFLDAKGIKERILPEAPLHPGFKYLSAVHKSDYLRCYFMHHFGGGYADIKSYSKNNNWKQCFRYINTYQDIWGIGVEEIMGGASIKELNTPLNVRKLLSTGCFIFRPHTEFTSLWYTRLVKKIEERYAELEASPSIDPFGGKDYPIRWAEILGDLFHRLLAETYDTNGARIRNCLRSGRLFIDYR